MIFKPTLFVFLMLLTFAVIAQNYVGTDPQNKNAIIEEFTGVRSVNCPAGHLVLAGILNDNPGRAFAVAYHPTNSSYTPPYAGDPDFTRAYPNAFYSTPYCGSARFMPSAFINRRLDAGERLHSRSVWESMSNTIMSEPSPANMGMATSYSSLNEMLSITVEIYFTDDISDDVRLYVMLSENDLVSQQSGASGPYTHKHTFRENLAGQWGDPISGTTTQGSLVTLEYEWNAAGSEYNMDNCEVLAFIENQTTGEIITGIGVLAGDQTYVEPTAAFSVVDNTVEVGSHAIFIDESSGVGTEWLWNFQGGYPATSTWPDPGPIVYNIPGQYSVSLTITNPAGTSTTTHTNMIDVNYAPEADFSASQINIITGGSIDFMDNSSLNPISWVWDFEGGTPAISVDQHPSDISYDTPGKYDVTLIATNDFGSNTVTRVDYINVSDVGIAETSTSVFSIYPNPSNGHLSIKSSETIKLTEVIVRNVSGQVLLKHTPSNADVQKLDLSDMESGLYLVEIKTEGNSFVEKVVLK